MEGFIVGWWQFMRELFLFLGKPKVFYYIFLTFSLVALTDILMSDLIWLKLGFGV